MDDFAECEHPTKRLTRRTVRGGAVQYVEQCTTCGISMNQPMSHARVAQLGRPIPDFDEDLLKRYDALREGFYRERRVAQKEEFFAGYNEYLGSPAWRDRRRKVMLRCQGICEGCRDASATEVHHLTYDNVTDEFLFELVGLCHACHERLHEAKRKREGKD